MKYISILGFLVLSSCMVGPDYKRPPLLVPAHYKAASGWVKAQPDDSAPKGKWWEAFNDPTLDKLEPQVQINNASLAADYYAYQQAVAITQEARGGLFPTLSLTSGATRARQDISLATSGNFEGQVSWNLDLWGKIRRQVESDAAQAQVSAADLANATLSAQAQLASDYVYLRSADANIVLLQKTILAYQESLTIAQNKFGAGTVSQSDVLTARTALDGAQSSLMAEYAVRAQYEHSIAVLTGHAPAEVSIPPGGQIQSIPIAPPQVPSTLLQRRPDIAAAERQMAAANAQIGIAEAAFYPDLSLSGMGGFAANPITGLFTTSSELWSLGTTATADLFTGGSRSQAVVAAQAAYMQSVETYRQTVLTAFQEVETDLTNLQIYAQQAQVEARAVADAGQAVQIAVNEYEAGTADYTTVASAQVTFLADQQTALSIQQSRLLASIALYQDLGGGFEERDILKPTPSQS